MANTGVNVEGVAWGIEGVTKLDTTEEYFVLRHIDDNGTYPGMNKEKKIATLKLVWQLCNPDAPKQPQTKKVAETKPAKNEDEVKI